MTAPQIPQLVTGYWISQAVHVAAKFDLARHLGDGPRSAEDVAAIAGTHPESTHRLLRALASVGIFAQDDSGRFAATPMSNELADPALRAFTMTACGAIFRAWADLDHSVQTGEPAFDRYHGKSVFEYLGDNQAEAELFDAGMTGIHGPETEPMIDAFDFSAFETVIDIGGGNGSVLSAVLRRNPDVRGILFDLPHVTDRAAATFEREGVADRCTVASGDFFAAVPDARGPTAYLMRHILHDWNDERSTTILRNCATAAQDAPGSRVLIVEMVIPPGNDANFGKWLDLMMLVIGGKERTEEEYRDLLSGAGLELARVVPTASDVSIVEGVLAGVS